MHELQVTLTNAAGDRLTLTVYRPTRTTPEEHTGCRIAKQMADLDHARYGSWVVVGSRWAS